MKYSHILNAVMENDCSCIQRKKGAEGKKIWWDSWDSLFRRKTHVQTLLTCLTLPRAVPAVGVRAVTVRENLWWHQLSEVSVVPATHNPRCNCCSCNWYERLLFKLRVIRAALVCRMVIECLVAIKRRCHRKSSLEQSHGKLHCGTFSSVFSAGFVQLTCCLQQIK